MVGRLFKIAGLIGGGILALGTGAVGTHFAHPTLEKTFFPKRLNEESKLKESLDDVNEQLKHLANSLESQTSINEIQEQTISGLDAEVKDLTTKSTEKDEELKNKDQSIAETQKKLEKQEQDNAEQKTRIKNLQSDYSQKETQFNLVKQQKEEFENSLNAIEEKLNLKREDILEDKALKLNTLKIEKRKITRKTVGQEWVTFETEDSENELKEFQFRKPKGTFVNYEQKAREFQKKGITFKLPDTFKTWDKSVSVEGYMADYFYVTNDPEKKKNFVIDKTKNKTRFKITEYFKDDYSEDAFRVLMALSYLEGLPICRVVNNNSEKKLEFCENSDISFDFSDKNTFFGKKFTGTDEESKTAPFWTNIFKTNDDFIKYWINKTVELIRTGTVDLLDFMNPLLLRKSYE